ncbi:hypothetical protein DM860_001700 [Cuscuta australis]|uniref:DUF668 domain-containing protein n=1 Tax=Cuscuta australis TaxID=267555 RepID=A0A328E9K5_9ASTE|nr:hypothetical protein DM860_001700 [Cuscuta australis]
MVAEPWLLRMGNQVGSNVKQALLLENSKKSSEKSDGKPLLGILSFEVANVMSMIIHLHRSLSDHEIVRLKSEILNSIGIRTLVSDDEVKIMELALVEKMDDLNRVAGMVSRLGRKCTIPALQGFVHVYGDITAGAIDVKELEFLVKDMEGMIRKMDRYVSSTSRLYTEMEAMNELEATAAKFKQNHHEEAWKACEQKLALQKQDVRHLKDVSLWNQTYDKVVELLARTVCTVYARISTVSQGIIVRRASSQIGGVECTTVDLVRPALRKRNGFSPSGGPSSSERSVGRSHGGGLFSPKDFNFACGIGLMECLTLSSSPKHEEIDDTSLVSGFSSFPSKLLSSVTSKVVGSSARFGPKSRLKFFALPSTVGGSALALHYANIIIVLQKLLQYPHLIGDEARDDLYQMLPESLRKKLKTKLKPYMKNLEIYDVPVAYRWRQSLEEILNWLSPLAHNMISWQTERNYEQHHVIDRTNVLLLQTLYFADLDKTEEVVCELLVGLNYICRYEQQQNAFLDCTSSLDFEEYRECQMHLGPSFQDG